MSKGALLIACNNNQVDYIKQAIFCAERIKKYLEIPVTLVTSNGGYLYENYKDKSQFFLKKGSTKHAGTFTLQTQIVKGLTEEDIKATRIDDLEASKKILKKYPISD